MSSTAASIGESLSSLVISFGCLSSVLVSDFSIGSSAGSTSIGSLGLSLALDLAVAFLGEDAFLGVALAGAFFVGDFDLGVVLGVDLEGVVGAFLGAGATFTFDIEICGFCFWELDLAGDLGAFLAGVDLVIFALLGAGFSCILQTIKAHIFSTITIRGKFGNLGSFIEHG